MGNMLILGMTMSLFGFTQKTFDYHYASLASVEGIKIVSKRKLKLEKLSKNSEIPVEYLIHREQYSLRFLIGDSSYFPHFKIVVEGMDNYRFTINPRRDTSVVSENGTICSSYYLDKKGGPVMDFGWSSGCLSDHIKREISFDVVDSSGLVVGSEDIPFILMNDGQYTLIDAL